MSSETKLVGKPECQIRSVKLEKGGLTIESVEVYTYDDDTTAECKENKHFPFEPHPDLIECIDALNVHFAALIGLDVAKVDVKGYGAKQLNSEEAQAHIKGVATCIDGKKVGMATPTIDLENTAYPAKRELNKLLLDLEREVLLYKLDHKIANPTLWQQGIKVA